MSAGYLNGIPQASNATDHNPSTGSEAHKMSKTWFEAAGFAYSGLIRVDDACCGTQGVQYLRCKKVSKPLHV